MTIEAQIGGGDQREKGLKLTILKKSRNFSPKFVKSASQQTRNYRFPLSGQKKFIQVKCMHSDNMPQDSGGCCTSLKQGHF